MKTFPLLKEKLAGYSAMAAMLFAAPKESEAQIIYKDIAPDDTLTDNSSYSLDLDNDGIFDFRLTDKYYENQCRFSSVSLMAYEDNSFLTAGSSYVVALNPGNLISGSQQYWYNGPNNLWAFYYDAFGSSSAMSCFDPQHLGPWYYVKDKFIGIAFNNSTGKHYGWIRFSDRTVIQDYAYNSIPAQPIKAGETGDCDTVQIHIDPTGPFTTCTNGYVTLNASYATPTFYYYLKWDYDGMEVLSSSDTLNVSATGNYTAILTGFGCEDSSNIVTITHENPPPQPSILLYNDTLFSSYPTSNQWYFYGNAISGATNSQYAFSQTGVYSVKYVLPYGCSSLSDNYYFSYVATGLSTEPDALLNIKMEDKHLTVELDPQLMGSEISFYDLFGRMKYKMVTTNHTEVIDLSNFSSGIYLCHIRKNERYWIKEFFID